MRFFPSFNTFIEIGPLSIQWYAVCILTGAAIAYFLGQYHFKKLGYSKEILSDYVFGLLFVGIIGARIWYVIFMWNELYANNPMEIIMINHGGLAIQGGVITGLIYSYFFFKKRNISFLVAGDAIMPGVLIAQACGRWGNFFNQEAYGSAVDLSFLKALHLPQFIIDKMYIYGQYYQPTFLYESLGCVIGFLIIFFIIRKCQQKQGIQFFTYFIWYGVIRFFIEAFRTDSLYVFGLKTAQLVSIVFVIVGLIGFIYCHFKGQDGRKTLVDFITKYRNDSYVVASSDIQEEVFLQRRIELWGEGLNWFDVMRLNKGVDRRGAGFPNDNMIFNIAPTDPILLWPIPQAEIQANQALSAADQNPTSKEYHSH